MTLSRTQQQALDQFAAAAVASERATGVPAEISCAQAILESGWGAHMDGCNCFGIKSYPGCPGVQLWHTTEWFTDQQKQAFLARGGGRTAEVAQPPQRNGARWLYHCQDLFASYPTLAECFAYHARLLTIGPYTPAWRDYQVHRNWETYLFAIAPIYATAPAYGNSVLSIALMPAVVAAISSARASK